MTKLRGVYNRLFDHFGPQGWWPGDAPFEVMVGAILTQNTNWGNVEKAIDNLKNGNFLTPKKLYSLPPSKLAEMIRPAGYFRVKTKRLRNFLKFFLDEYDGSIDKIREEELEDLRPKILSVSGVGPETADSILLYAVLKPIFVVDAYTKRILSRHNLISEDADYNEIQGFFIDSLPLDVKLFNEFHALIVKCGKSFCRIKNPKCSECPLESF